MKNKIKYYRNLYNITQEELAKKSNITLRYLQKIEKGYSIPTVIIADRISKALNKNIYDIFEL